MINEKLDAILCDYVEKTSKFCKSYVEEVLGKNYSSFSGTLCNIYRDFEDELSALKNEAEMTMAVEIGKAVNTGEDISGVTSYDDDLLAMHKYYRNMYSSKIAMGLAEQWRAAALKAKLELFLNNTIISKNHEGGTNL
jgi:hypothetical protein